MLLEKSIFPTSSLTVEAKNSNRPALDFDKLLHTTGGGIYVYSASCKLHIYRGVLSRPDTEFVDK
jgi:hypothetical protein